MRGLAAGLPARALYGAAAAAAFFAAYEAALAARPAPPPGRAVLLQPCGTFVSATVWFLARPPPAAPGPAAGPGAAAGAAGQDPVPPAGGRH